MKYFLISVMFFVLVGCGKNDPFAAKKSGYTQSQLDAIEERIKPYSVVNVSGGAAVEVASVSWPGEAKYAACSACHGANGGGGVGPMLAGQSVEYIVGHLTAYRNGEKVGRQSNLMWAQASGLSDTDIQDLAEYTASF